jgi:FMN-dependent NADH-azoreductase
MSSLLFIEASPRAERSVSTQLGAQFAEAQARAHGLTLDRLALWETVLPEFDGDILAAKYARLAGTPHTPAQADAWATIERMVERLRAADRVVIATPMWNLGVPYKLKHWIDLVTQPGLSFSFDLDTGYTPLLTPRPVTAIIASAGDFSSGLSWGRPDLASPYLRAALGFIGLSDVEIVLAGPTAGDQTKIAAGREAARRLLEGSAA